MRSPGMLASLETVRSRFVLKPLDAVMTARLGPPCASSDQGGSGSISKYRKTQRAAVLLGDWFPRVSDWVCRRLFNPRYLPFADVGGVRLLGWGTGTTVFLLEPLHGGEGRVLKVYRYSLGRRRHTLVRQARQQRATYERLRAWYDESGVLVPTSFVILHSPLLSQGAVANLQPHVAGPHRDLFTDVSEAELKDLLDTCPPFRRQFASFARATVAAADRDGACADLAGRNNIVLVEHRGGVRLVLLDIGVHDFSARTKATRGGSGETLERLAYLRRLYHEAMLARDVEQQ